MVKKNCFTAETRRSALDLLRIYFQTLAILTRPPVGPDSCLHLLPSRVLKKAFKVSGL